MKYMPSNSAATCAAVSYAIYHLSQSPDMAANTTEYAFGWQQATDGSWWMEWHEDMVIPVHAEHTDDLASILAGFVAVGQLTQSSADAIMSLAEERVNGSVMLSEVTPPDWAALMLSEVQAAPLWPIQPNIGVITNN